MNQNWITTTIEELCNIEYGTRVVRKKDAGTIYPVYGGGGATFSMDIFNREDRMVIARFAMSEKCTRFISGKFFLNDSGLTISPKSKELIYTKFLNYQIFSLNDTIYSIGRGTAQRNLNSEAFKNLNISYPKSFEEQKQIVEILDKAFESIEQAKINIEKNIENTKELFQSRLNEIFSQKGDGWEEKELGKLAEFRNGLNFNKSSKGETFKIVGVSNFKDNFYVDNDSLEEVTIDGKLKELDLLKNGDIVAVRSNGNPNLIGRCMLLANIEEKISFSGFTIRIRLIDKNIYPLFLNYFLKSSYIKNELIKSGNGTDIRNLNQQSLSSLVFKYPLKIEKQKRIVNEIDKLSEQTKQLEKHYKQKLKNLEELKKSILQKAFSGELLNDS